MVNYLNVGIVCNRNVTFTHAIYTGFLQNCGIAYAILATLYELFPLDKRVNDGYFERTSVKTKMYIALIFPITNLLLTFTLVVPECPKGYMLPGGIAQQGTYQNCTGGAAGFIDIKIWGSNHLPIDPACRYCYGCQGFTRYGLLALLNFIFSVYLGMAFGEFFLLVKQFNRRVWALLSAFFVSTVIAVLLGFVSKNMYSAILPISKPLWSFSYVMLVNAICLILFLFLWIAHEKKIINGWPVRAIGLNAIGIYVLNALAGQRFPFCFQTKGDHMTLMLSNLLGLSTWILIALFLHKYRFYVKY
mgnify:CR=1 FL=1